MSRNPIIRFTARAFLAFDFLTPEDRASFALTTAKFAAAFGVGYAVQLTGVLDPAIARGNEILAALFVVLVLPMIATLCRRLTDARLPLILSVLPLLVWAAASAAEVMFGLPGVATVLEYAAMASVVVLVVALCFPSSDGKSTMEMPS